jgi:hypothetical protein
VGFVVDKVVPGQGFSKSLAFSGNSHLMTTSSSGADTIGQIMADVSSGLSLTPPQTLNNKTYKINWHFCTLKTDVHGFSVFTLALKITCILYSLAKSTYL